MWLHDACNPVTVTIQTRAATTSYNVVTMQFKIQATKHGWKYGNILKCKKISRQDIL